MLNTNRAANNIKIKHILENFKKFWEHEHEKLTVQAEFLAFIPSRAKIVFVRPQPENFGRTVYTSNLQRQKIFRFLFIICAS